MTKELASKEKDLWLILWWLCCVRKIINNNYQICRVTLLSII